MIGASDFAVEGKYSYADVEGDSQLKHFSIAPDSMGFPVEKYPGVRDPSYDLLPMIKEALAIKARQQDKDLKIIASAWTAPPWMKDIETWFIPGSPENNWQGTGGALKKEYVPVYADYLTRYLDAYRGEGVDIWGITPVNEPLGNGGNWESMHFSAESQNDFVKNHLGPKLHAGKNSNIKLLVYDQNRDHLEAWADAILGDPETARYVYGMAVHWYSSTYKVYEDTLDGCTKSTRNSRSSIQKERSMTWARKRRTAYSIRSVSRRAVGSTMMRSGGTIMRRIGPTRPPGGIG